MNTIRMIILSLILCYSCQFNQSVKKDLSTGAFSRGDGLGCDDVTMEINGDLEKRNEFNFGENVTLIFNDVSGLTTSDNKTYPGLSIYIVKNEKDTVLANPNLLKSLDHGTDLSPLQLQAKFVTALPNQNKETYKVLVTISDRKGDGKFKYELPFTIKKNDLLKIDSKGIDYSNIYLWNETLQEPVFDKNVSAKDELIVILEDVEGLEVKSGKVFPKLSIDITDAQGNMIISNPNILSAYETDGVNPEDLKAQLTAKITFTEGVIKNPCQVLVKLTDKNSAKAITIKTELNIN